MVKLPLLSGKEVVKCFERAGYRLVRQKGSHMRLIHPSDFLRGPLTIPDHREVRLGTLRKCLRDANMTIEEFLALG